MKNITVSVDDETYRQSRIKAAEAGTAVSALVRSFRNSLARGEAPSDPFLSLYQLQQETMSAIRARGGGLRAADKVARDSLHERDALS